MSRDGSSGADRAASSEKLPRGGSWMQRLVRAFFVFPFQLLWFLVVFFATAIPLGIAFIFAIADTLTRKLIDPLIESQIKKSLRIEETKYAK
jgi:hypothetical protein